MKIKELLVIACVMIAGVYSISNGEPYLHQHPKGEFDDSLTMHQLERYMNYNDQDILYESEQPHPFPELMTDIDNHDEDYPVISNLLWESIGPEGGYVRYMAQNPLNLAELYACMYGYPGSVYKSINFGQTWQRIKTLDYYLHGISIDPVNPDILYITTGYKILKSTDGGENWDDYIYCDSLYSYVYEAVVIDPTNTDILYSVGQGYNSDIQRYGLYVFKSTNSGENWTPLPLTGYQEYVNAYSIAMDPTNPDVIYAGGYYRSEDGNAYVLYKTENSGVNWVNTNSSNVITRYPEAIAIDPVNPNNVYVSTIMKIYRSTNGGDTWISNITNAQAYSLMIDPSHTNIIYGGYYNICYKSLDYGVTWVYYSNGQRGSSTGLLMNSNGDIIYSSTSGFYLSNDDGISWQESNSGLVASLVSSMAIARSSPNVILAGLDYVGLRKSSDYGQSWQEYNSPDYCGGFKAVEINQFDSEIVYVIGGI